MRRTAVIALATTCAAAVGRADRLEGPMPKPVVFVCAHGNVKSVIASEWFNRRAAQRGLAVRAVSRGLEPEGAVPAAIAERLSAEGFDVRAYRARALEAADVEGAALLVVIGVEAPSMRPHVPLERWDGIPPASERYEASRDAMRERIESLLDRIADRRP